jgi:glycosyltransferase involved in cell wall biosynthesis
MAEAAGLRVLVVGMKWPPETFLARLLEGLAGRGYAITVALPSRPRDEAFHRSRFGWLPLPNGSSPRPLRLIQATRAVAGGALRATPALAQAVREAGRGAWAHRLVTVAPFAGRRWDLIYFPWNGSAIAMLPLFNLGMPVVVSCRGSQLKVAPRNPAREAIRGGLRETFRRAALVHCVSQDILDEARNYGLDPARAELIRPAVDIEFFRPAAPETGPGDGDGPLRIITTGSLIWRKGYEFALRAVAGLRARGVPAQLEVIGDGPERQRILYTAHDLGIDDSVVLLGRLGPERVRDHLRSADAFVLSSLCEGISNAVLEAMACGLPVVVTDCGGMREAVDDGVEGFVVPVRAPGAMADALGALAGSGALRRRMGRAARLRIERDFNLDDQIDRWDGLCRRVVAGGRT